jgi:hypothetical protein
VIETATNEGGTAQSRPRHDRRRHRAEADGHAGRRSRPRAGQLPHRLIADQVVVRQSGKKVTVAGAHL